MNKWFCFLINNLLIKIYKKDYKKFVGIRDVEKQQKDYLMKLLTKNHKTLYGRKYDFSSINKVSEYQNQVPLSTYSDYEDYVEKIKKGELNVLTSDRIILLEPTSGSSASPKFIPYTESLKEEFQKGLRPWLYDLHTKKPDILMGKSYWSITPAITRKQFSSGGIPIGFEEDSSYFGAFEKKLIDLIFAVPKEVNQSKDIYTFYMETSIYLLLCRNLTLISIWNPSFLFLILKFMHREGDNLINIIHKKDPKRAEEVEELLKKEDYQGLWPNLELISCWLDGNAIIHEKQLKKWFPRVFIQPKGILATEGFFSFPFVGEEGSRLSLRSHFFEFLNIDNQKIYLAHELVPGQTYEVIVTTSGGLYRYNMKDLIEVTSYKGVFPLIKFLGKTDGISDIFGEKLHEILVEEALKEVAKKLNLTFTFAMLAPEGECYVLYLQLESENYFYQFAQELDDLLRKNFHYDYCRRLGQLKPLKIFLLTGNPHQEYLEECVKQGQRQGDVKSTYLHLKSGWDLVFKGEYI